MVLWSSETKSNTPDILALQEYDDGELSLVPMQESRSHEKDVMEPGLREVVPGRLQILDILHRLEMQKEGREDQLLKQLQKMEVLMMEQFKEQNAYIQMLVCLLFLLYKYS